MTRRRDLSSQDEEDWARVKRSVLPLHPDRPRIPAEDRSAPKPAAKPGPVRVPLSPFGLGQSALTRPALLPGLSSPAQRLAQEPLRMDAKTHRRMAGGKLNPEARLDLHGRTLAAAHPALAGFVLSCHARGLRLVLVITGKGRGDGGPLPFRPGALRHHVPDWLRMPPLGTVVQQVAPAHRRHGGEGAYYVYLRRSG